MFQVGEQVQELKKLVHINKSILVLVRGSLDQPEEMKKSASQLIDVQSLLQVFIILKIGFTLASLINSNIY